MTSDGANLALRQGGGERVNRLTEYPTVRCIDRGSQGASAEDALLQNLFDPLSSENPM